MHGGWWTGRNRPPARRWGDTVTALTEVPRDGGSAVSSSLPPCNSSMGQAGLGFPSSFVSVWGPTLMSRGPSQDLRNRRLPQPKALQHHRERRGDRHFGLAATPDARPHVSGDTHFRTRRSRRLRWWGVKATLSFGRGSTTALRRPPRRSHSTRGTGWNERTTRRSGSSRRARPDRVRASRSAPRRSRCRSPRDDTSTVTLVKSEGLSRHSTQALVLAPRAAGSRSLERQLGLQVEPCGSPRSRGRA